MGAASDAAPVRLWSLYVPNGRELTHPHYMYKLDWLRVLRDDVATWLGAEPDLPLALVGDWNVAPKDEDVWDMSVFEGATHVSAPEREARRLRRGGNARGHARAGHQLHVLGLPEAALPEERGHAH